jgi:hypothetical protein
VLVRAYVGGLNPAPSGFDTTGFPLFRVTPDGTIQRYLAHVTPFPGRTINSQVDGMSLSMSVPHLASSLAKVSSRGSRLAALTPVYAGANANTMRVVVYGINGDTIYARNYPFVGERIPAAAADNAVDQMVAAMGRSLGGRGVPASAREEMRRRVPPVYAPYTDMIVGDDGTLLVGLRSEASAPRPYLLIDARGEPAGRFTLPASTTPLAVSATHIWGVERDSLEVPSVVRLRMSR